MNGEREPRTILLLSHESNPIHSGDVYLKDKGRHVPPHEHGTLELAMVGDRLLPWANVVVNVA